MDIYEQAKLMNADYYDFRTGYIYLIQEYHENLKTNPDTKIRIIDHDGHTIGYASKIMKS